MRFPTGTCLFAILMVGHWTISPGLAEDLGLGTGMESRTVIRGLCNPSSISFSPSGELTVCDSGAGRVLVLRDGKAEVFADGFTTEYWKVDAETGAKRFRLGPLSAVWTDASTLAVTNAGLKDGQETVAFFKAPGDVAQATVTNAVGPTSDDPADKGEGNLCGMSLAVDGKHLFVAGQGADAKSWVLAVDVAAKRMVPLLSADEAGIETNSPMATLPWGEDSLLVLYSGAGGKEDGLLVEWSLSSQRPLRKWSLPGLNDPMGMARIAGTNQLVVVDNNWSLTEVLPGKLAKVSLPTEDGPAKIEVLTENLRGPVSCAFGPSGDLFIAQLGKTFDGTDGEVIAIRGITSK